MTLTLVNEEVVVYMTMKQQIEALQSALKSANEEIALKTQDYWGVVKELDTEHEWKEPPSTLSEPVEFADAHTTWTDEEKDVLRSRIFHTGMYYGASRSFLVIRALFPNRTESGVKSMIYLLGGTCRNGIVQPKLKGVK